MRHARILVLLAGLILPSSVYAAQPQLKAGKWEITIRTEAPIPSPPSTMEVCILKAFGDKPEAPKLKSSDDCKVLGGAGLSGNVLSYTVKCGKRNATTVARFVFLGETYEGTVETTGDGPAIRQTYKAKRIGNCDEDDPEEKP